MAHHYNYTQVTRYHQLELKYHRLFDFLERLNFKSCKGTFLEASYPIRSMYYGANPMLARIKKEFETNTGITIVTV